MTQTNVTTIIWHGTSAESDDLLAALDRNCTCQYEETTGAKTSNCPGHLMMLEDQKTLDGLLFYRSIVKCLEREEGLN